jgi:hypothetical protein
LPTRLSVDAAGWRRLKAMNRALGEMAHARIGSRWDGARNLLAQLQPSFPQEMSIYTDRGFCLDTLVLLAARELLDSIQLISPAVALSFSKVLGLEMRDESRVDSELEAFLNRAFARRTVSLGSPSIKGPELKWAYGGGSPALACAVSLCAPVNQWFLGHLSSRRMPRSAHTMRTQACASSRQSAPRELPEWCGENQRRESCVRRSCRSRRAAPDCPLVARDFRLGLSVRSESHHRIARRDLALVRQPHFGL